jgi:hypothetical protein
LIGVCCRRWLLSGYKEEQPMTIKETDGKDIKERKDSKDIKERKDSKDIKERKDSKENKENPLRKVWANQNCLK